MNCKHVQELLPLYVSGDVEERRARHIAAHAQSCAECAGVADEYGATRQLLENFTPPLFSEAVYAGIRRCVLREIERDASEATAPSLPRLVAGLFRPRLGWAVATALLLAVTVFAFYFIASRGNERRQVADVQTKAPSGKTIGAVSSSPTVPESRENDGPPINGTDRDKRNDSAIAGSGDPTHPPRRRKSRPVVAHPQTTVAANTNESSPEGNKVTEPDAVPAREPGAEKILRLEMQTKDPNIRIIWFSPQRPKPDSRGKFSKGV